MNRADIARIVIESARRNIVNFAKVVKPEMEFKDFHLVYYELLDRFARGEIRRMFIQMPPQHGKSEGSSRILPSYILGLLPSKKVFIGSYSADHANDFCLDVQRIIESEGYKAIFPGTRLSSGRGIERTYKRTQTVFDIVGKVGGLRTAGRGGALTGKTVDVSILDDVYKDYAEGNSPTVREAAWKWYTTVVKSRLHNDSQELIVFTRWNGDDLIGRIIKSGDRVRDIRSFDDLEGIRDDEWVRVNFEALKTGVSTEIDPRGVGEALWPELHSSAELEAQKRRDPVQFQCLYQGNPISAETRLYSPFKTWADKSEWGRYVRSGCYVDVADQGSDYLCAMTYDVYKSEQGEWDERKRKNVPLLFALITEIEYTQAGTEVTTRSVSSMINRNRVQKAWIESNNGGGQFEKSVKTKVRAVTVAFHQSGNKESRILTCAAGVNAQIVFPIGWEDRYPRAYEHLRDFLRNFGANAHDDIADCVTGIYEKELSDGDATGYRIHGRGVRVAN